MAPFCVEPKQFHINNITLLQYYIITSAQVVIKAMHLLLVAINYKYYYITPQGSSGF